ncbi:MAG: glycine zipper domain-containing protein [Pseudomonadota bacterium]
MDRYHVIKIFLTGVLSATTLAGCENLPGTREQQGAAIGGAAGLIAGSSISDGDLFGTVLGGALGAGAGYLIGANSDKLFGGSSANDAQQAVSKAQTNPATAADVSRSSTADLNKDGFVTTDELVAMADAGLSDQQMIDRLRATNQVFDLSRAQEDRLASQGVSRNVLREMRDINREERERVISRQRG